MHQQRLYVLIAAAAGMLGTFLPWVSLPFLGSVSGTSAGAIGKDLALLPQRQCALGGDDALGPVRAGADSRHRILGPPA